VIKIAQKLKEVDKSETERELVKKSEKFIDDA
jgi:hypothetical protein